MAITITRVHQTATKSPLSYFLSFVMFGCLLCPYGLDFERERERERESKSSYAFKQWKERESDTTLTGLTFTFRTCFRSLLGIYKKDTKISYKEK